MTDTILTIITGPMYSGKTTFLTNIYKKYKSIETIIFNHSIDNRYLDSNDGDLIIENDNSDDRFINSTNTNGFISSHDGIKINCIKVSESEQIYNKILEYKSLYYNIKNIIIDECQFFTNIDIIIKKILHNCPEIINITCAGLDLDAKGNIFNQSFTKLFTIADNLNVLKSTCYKCGYQAQYTICTTKNNLDENNIMVGSNNYYQPSCEKHLNY